MPRLLLLISLAACVSGVSAQDLSPFSPSDPEALRVVRDPRISPEGDWVAYVVRTSDLKKDRGNSDIWMVSWDGAQTLQLTHTEKEGESSPRWSPDGRYLSFLVSRGDEDAKSQVWLLERRGGEARQLTELPGGVEDYEWSPDSRRLALIAADPDPEEEGKKQAEKDDAPKTPKPIVIDRYQFKRDRVGYLRHLRSHLYVFDVGARTAELLTPGDFDESSPAWSPAGKEIAFVSKRGEDPDRHDNSDIFLIEAKKGAEARQLTRHEGADGSFGGAPAWSPDGTWIAYLRGGPPRWSFYDGPDLAIISAAGGEPRVVTEDLDRDVYRPAWAADGGSLLMLLEDDRNQYLARVSAGGGPVERLSAPGAAVDGFHTSGGRVALLMTTPEAPAEIFAFERATPRPLSNQNEERLAGLLLGSVSGIEFESADGTKVHGIVTKPPGFEAGQRYPTILLIHGGPTAQNGFEFDATAQVLAGAGYLVVRPNYRGSSGRGREFSRAIFADWGNLEVQDVLAAADHVVEAGLADPERLGIGGWSYGGMTTNYTIAKDTRFKAAVSGASIANVLTGYGTDQYIRQYENELGKPWEEIDKYFNVSHPFLHADRIVTPTLFMCGEKDFNVPLINSEQMYQALRSLGIETRLVIYPGQYHGLGKPSYRKDRHERYIAWFDRFLKEAEE